MRAVVVSCLLLASLCVRAAESGFERLRGSYERFFVSRYALEQEFPFRLVSVRDRLVRITPNTDVRQPLLALAVDDFLAGEEVEALLTKSFLPLFYDTTTTTHSDALHLIRQFASRAMQQLRGVTQEKLQLLLRKIPDRQLSYTLFLAPYRKTDADLYYGKQKISMVRSGTVNLRTADSDDAQHHISKEIDRYRAWLFYHYRKEQSSVPTLLAARLRFDLHEQETRLSADVLLNVFPSSMPFEKEEPPISLQNFIVPSGAQFRFPTALLSIRSSLNNPQPPQLHISFGNFKALENMQFVFEQKNSHHYTPYLEGNLQKFSPLLVKFRLQKLSLSLEKLQAETVRTVFSTGFQLGKLRSAYFGRFKIASIDEKFKTAINKEIDTSKDKILNETLAAARISKFVGNSVAAASQMLLGRKNTSSEVVP